MSEDLRISRDTWRELYEEAEADLTLYRRLLDELKAASSSLVVHTLINDFLTALNNRTIKHG